MHNSETPLARSLPATLQMLGQARTSGVVTVRSGERVASVLLMNGKVLAATSDRARRLGDSLVERGALSREVLEQTLQLQKRKKIKQPLATVLHQFGLVSREVAEAQIEEQITSVLTDILDWGAGDLDVQPMDMDGDQTLPPACQDVEKLLVRVATRRAECAA